MQYSKFRVSTTFQMSNSNENWCQTATYFCLNLSPGGSDGKASARSAGDPGFDPWVGKILWRRVWQPTSVSLPGESHGQRSLEGCSPWGRRELDTTEWLSTYVSILGMPFTSGISTALCFSAPLLPRGFSGLLVFLFTFLDPRMVTCLSLNSWMPAEMSDHFK